MFDIRSNLVQAVSVFKINWSLELAQGSELKDDREKVMTWSIIIRRRVMRVDLDERSNILGGLFNPPSAESTPRAANTRTLPLFRHQFSNV